MVLQHRTVIGRGAVKADLAADFRLALGPFRGGLARDGEHRRVERNRGVWPAARALPGIDGGLDHIVDVADRVDGMDMEAVGNLARRPAHALVHAGKVDGDSGIGDRTRIEERIHQPELVELALVGRPRIVLEGIPDRPHAADIVRDPRRRTVEGHGKAALHMGAHLGAEPQMKTAAAG